MAARETDGVAVVIGVGAGLGAELARKAEDIHAAFAFGPAKFGLRGLAQVMARELGPQGVHVAYVNVDGAIDMPAIRKRFPELKDEDMLKPDAIAETYWHVAHQDPSAWTQEVDVRPFKEKF